MASTEDLQVLVDFGLFNGDGVARLANLIRQIQAISGTAMGAAVKAAGRPGRPAAGARKRAPRGRFDPTKEELAKMRQDGMTAKAIAAKFRVSMATVNLRLRKLGLTNPRKGKAGKK
jgi:DNA-binding NarL/FixJ family response regulator